jgi:hypothetical protein
MRIAAALGLLALAGACGAHAKAIYLPSGERGFEINCGGPYRSMGDCMNKAAEMCGGPYRVLGSDQHGTIVYNLASGEPMYAEARHLTVVCGGSMPTERVDE